MMPLALAYAVLVAALEWRAYRQREKARLAELDRSFSWRKS